MNDEQRGTVEFAENLLENSSNVACREDASAKWTVGYASICTSHPKKRENVTNKENYRTLQMRGRVTYLFVRKSTLWKAESIPSTRI
jgi:1,2-phenylacetyl-CoA epoxidase PaaB subunit